MQFQNILITGGAGFVGSNLAVRLKQHADVRVIALDNLKRRGSELNLPRLREHGVEFQHGDIRCGEDFESLPPFDLLLDCAAEPSVQAGMQGSPAGVLQTNLVGTIQSLEAARRHQASVIFLSTSRVYPIERLNALPFAEEETRFRWQHATTRGFSEHGIAEEFALEGPRSYYGASKLASELLLQEYVYSAGLPALINRCGILAGPWQMGKADQGVLTLWVARHHYQRPLKYIGFGGSGKQVRDALHIDDLFDLLWLQMNHRELWDGRVYNVGGGEPVSISLRELTHLCRSETGHDIPIDPAPETSSVDVRVYLTDARKVQDDFGWKPSRGPQRIVSDIHRWIVEGREPLRSILC